jgi:MoaA/NifB/PqqE/SkfB family radical SAM enzyme
VIRETREAGISRISFIGGEPTLHPGFAELLGIAVGIGLKVQVCTNGIQFSDDLWRAFSLGLPTLQISYYSDDQGEHDRITGVPGSHKKTTANIVNAVRKGMRITVSVIHIERGQRIEQAVRRLAELGVTEVKIDRVRRIGRAAPRNMNGQYEGELCGKCAGEKFAVLPNGDLVPCTLARRIILGNVQSASLESLLLSDDAFRARERIRLATATAPIGTSSCNGGGDNDACAP